MFEASTKTLLSISNAEFGGVAHVSAESYEMRLFSDVVGLDGAGTELTTGGYAPVEFDNNSTNFPIADSSDDIKQNANVIQTDVFTEDSPAIRSVGFFDEDGDLRYRKVYPANTVYVLEGNVFRLSAGQLKFTPE